MKDWNLCEHCSRYVPIECKDCLGCEQPLVLESSGISIWRLGEIRDGVLGPLASQLKTAFKTPVVIQPAFLDERPSVRTSWRGISSTAFLNQAYRRHAGGLVSFGVTEKNIVPDSRYNFLFGYAYMGLPAAVASLHPLLADEPSRELLVSRLAGITIHEIGHTLGLDHHGYDDGVDCVMVGDVGLDSLETIDEGSSQFCDRCRRVVERRVQRLEAAA